MATSLQRGIQAMIEQIDAPMATFFSACVHCGLCADACLFYTETQDPKYTPIHKLAPMRRVWQQEFTFWGKLMKKLGLSKPVTDAELAEWEPLVYDSCTLCGRCSLVCPVGNDIAYMVRKMREGMVASGHAPDGLKESTRRAIELGSPMGITIKTLQAHFKHAEQETGLVIPLDREGANYLLVLSSAEVANFSEIIPAVTRIFHQAGVSWTMASDGFEATNSGIQIGSSDLAAELVGRIVKAAERLKVKYVISPECGHAYTALRWEGPNLIGRPYPFQVVQHHRTARPVARRGPVAHRRHGRHAHDFPRPVPDGAARRRDSPAAQPARYGRTKFCRDARCQHTELVLRRWGRRQRQPACR